MPRRVALGACLVVVDYDVQGVLRDARGAVARDSIKEPHHRGHKYQKYQGLFYLSLPKAAIILTQKRAIIQNRKCLQ